ncbi:helix-turn-helix domain-containing protein [Sediminispirochaeta bajacaliforniensis]|uniref:helix-turn-helix domain-containing protein n=1 Tax=Sediminispirochaeta bajacaliforniensis TaxID=148 RepID=UPI0003611AE6|nr:helix-turn-helix transcriptional regulator [Sediminispirochaeta bajacaliforniensis]
MEFNAKLQQLRTNAGLTQEQLAEKLFVSRVTVSKWESGRGYPNIESLKLIAKVFSVLVDELLSGDELITIAENQTREASRNICSLVFGVLDFMSALLLVLPFFGNQKGEHVEFVALPALNISYDILLVSYIAVITTTIFGVAELAMQNLKSPFWLRLKIGISSCLSVFSVLLFIMTRQPYASSFLLCLLVLKGILLIKKE